MSEKPERLSEAELQQAAPHPLAPEEAWLPIALLAAPVAWSVHLALSYGLVYPAERWQSKALLHVVGLASALCSLSSVALGWRGLRRSRLGGMLDRAQRERARFLCSCACVLGLFFLLATLAQSIPVFMLTLGAR